MNEITIYGKPTCPKCEQAKKELEKRQVPFDYVDISDPWFELEEFLNTKALGMKTVPVIFEGDYRIGGCDEMMQSLAVKDTRDDIRGLLREGVVKITFTKKDGTERVMEGTLNSEYLLKNDPKYDPDKIVNAEPFFPAVASTQAVWEIGKGWRSFVIGAVTAVA